MQAMHACECATKTYTSTSNANMRNVELNITSMFAAVIMAEEGLHKKSPSESNIVRQSVT